MTDLCTHMKLIFSTKFMHEKAVDYLNQSAFTCSSSTMETPELSVKSVQSYQ